MSRPYGFHSLPYQTQMSIRRSEGDVQRARGRAAANAREAEAATAELTALRAQVSQLTADLEVAVEGLSAIEQRSHDDPMGSSKVIDMRNIARATLSTIRKDG